MIFISYRRDGGREIARTVQLGLKSLGYEEIFFDYNSLRDGVFDEQIITAINNCDDFILILSKGSMDRCSNADDWVAREIRTAISAGAKMIPVVIDSADWVWPEDFPRDLRLLKSLQFTTLLTNEYFDDSIRHLTERLESKPSNKAGSTSSHGNNRFNLVIGSDETCEIFISGERISKLKAGKKVGIDILEKGKDYEICVKSLARQKDQISFSYHVPLFSGEEERTVSFTDYRTSRDEAIRTEKLRLKQLKQEQNLERRKNQANMIEILGQYDYHSGQTEGMTIVGSKSDGGYKYGAVDANGMECVECIYDNAAAFSEGVAAFLSDGMWSYYDKEGALILDKVSETPGLFRKGVVPISRNGRFGLMRITGEILIPCEYDIVSQPNDYYLVCGLDHVSSIYKLDTGCFKMGLFDHVSLEKENVDVNYSYSTYIVPDEHVPISRNGKKGLLLKNGEVGIKCCACEIKPLSENVFKVDINGKYGIYDVSKAAFLMPAKYRTLEITERGYFLVSEESRIFEYFVSNKFGLMNDSGYEIIPQEYSYFCGLSTDFYRTRTYMTDGLVCIRTPLPANPYKDPGLDSTYLRDIWELDDSISFRQPLPKSNRFCSERIEIDFFNEQYVHMKSSGRNYDGEPVSVILINGIYYFAEDESIPCNLIDLI